jgi:hypothetical protein
MGRAAKLVARPAAAAEIATLVLSAAKPRREPEQVGSWNGET